MSPSNENSSLPKVEEGIDRAIPDALSMNGNVAQISMRDRGIVMTKEDLIKNLGTIAKHGTSSFLEQMHHIT
jgi:heat shock protein beta